MAASFVLFFHVYNSGNKWIDFIIGRGDSAVSLFFILSGFLITNSYMGKSQNFKEYLFRRCQKIMPQWFLSIVLMSMVTGGFGISFFRVILAVFLFQTLYPPNSLDLHFVGWSLSVELVMYLVLFFILKNVNLKSRFFLHTVWVIWFITQTAYLMLLSFPTVFSRTNDYFYFFLNYHPVWHLSSFLMGISFAVYYNNNLKSTLPFKIPGGALGVSFIYVAFLFISFYFGYKIGLSGFYHNGFFAPITGMFLIAICIIETECIKSSFLWRNKVFDLLGSISFGIYLFHIPILNLLNQFYTIRENGISFWVYFFVVLLFSYVAQKILDERLHRITNPLLLRFRNGS